MPYTNIKDVLIDAVKYPTAIEAKLPAGAPVISTMLLDIAGKIPAVPNFPVEIPDLPAPPTLPEFPGAPAEELRRRFVTEVKVTPLTKNEVIPSPAAGVIPEVVTRRGM